MYRLCLGRDGPGLHSHRPPGSPFQRRYHPHRFRCSSHFAAGRRLGAVRLPAAAGGLHHLQQRRRGGGPHPLLPQPGPHRPAGHPGGEKRHRKSAGAHRHRPLSLCHRQRGGLPTGQRRLVAGRDAPRVHHSPGPRKGPGHGGPPVLHPADRASDGGPHRGPHRRCRPGPGD